jgi:NADH-quinone oxidoreductase subunit N
LPPTAGFIGKLLVFSAALEMYNSTGSMLVMVLIIAGALVTLVSLFYYIKVPLNAYLRQSNHEVEITEVKTFKIYLSLFLTIIILILGMFPQLLTRFIVI